MRYLRQRYNTLWFSRTVPKPLREAVGKASIEIRLGHDLKHAKAQLPKCLEVYNRVVEAATQDQPDLVEEALRFREMGRYDDPEMFGAAMGEYYDSFELQRPDLYKIAMGHKTPIDGLGAAFAKSRSLTPLTTKRTLQRLAKLSESMSKPMEEVTRQMAHDYVQERLTEVLPTTVRAEVSEFKAYWEYAKAAGVRVDSVWNVKIKDRRRIKRQPMTEEDIEALLDLGGLCQDVVLILSKTGMRISELLSCEVSSNCFKVAISKTAAGVRSIPVHPELEEVLSRRHVTPLFPEITSSNQLSKLGNTWIKEAGLHLPGAGAQSVRTLHSIRHYVATRLEQHGVPESTIAALLGHSRKGVTFGVYAHGPSIRQLRQAVLQLK